MGKGGDRNDNKRSFASVRDKLSKFNSKGDGHRKGKGKGKGFGKDKGKRRTAAAIKSPFWERKKDEENRSELSGTYTGVIAKYVFKQGWGQITPDETSSFPDDIVASLEKQRDESKAKAEEKGREPTEDLRVYFRKPDVDPDLFPLEEGDQVSFELYSDDKGAGAHHIQGAEGAPKKEKPPPREGKSKGKGGKSDKGKGRYDSGGKGKHDSGGAHKHVIELQETDPSFALRQKIVGPGGQNVNHVQDQCGGHVQVSKYQPLTVTISCDSEKKLNQAVRMLEDLIGVVWEEYSSEYLDKRKPKGGSKGKGRKDDRNDRNDRQDRNDRNSSKGSGKGKDKGSSSNSQSSKGQGKSKSSGSDSRDSAHKKILKVRPMEPEFRLRSALVGEGGAYVKHIQEECKVKMYVKEENGETRVELSADTQDALRKAEGMAKDLIQAAYGKYDEWKAAKSSGGKSGSGSGKGGSSSGKGGSSSGKSGSNSGKGGRDQGSGRDKGKGKRNDRDDGGRDKGSGRDKGKGKRNDRDDGPAAKRRRY